jgi:hypothetical protein
MCTEVLRVFAVVPVDELASFWGEKGCWQAVTPDVIPMPGAVVVVLRTEMAERRRLH